MSTLRERLEAMSPEDCQHTLLAMPELLFACPAEHPALCRLVKRFDWYEAKRTLVGDQSYARDLDLALRAAQTKTVPLDVHLILSLLRATFNTLVSRTPATAVEALSHSGEQDRAAYLAGQRADPAYRCEALCGVALGAQRRGDLAASARALDQAREAIDEVDDPTIQAELLCTIALGYDRGNRPAHASASLASAAERLPEIVDDRQRTHACAYVARVAEDLEQMDLAYQAARTIRAIYEQHAVPRKKEEREKGAERGKGGGWIWDVARYTSKLGLFDRPGYLVALATWDQTRERRYPSDYYAVVPALVLRTAAANGDRATCQAVVDEALAYKPKNRPIDLPPAMVEAFAETGYGARARAVVEKAAADGLDTSLLCTAWAKGAGAAGDVEAILTAVDLASSGGGFEGLRTRLAQRVVGLGNQERIAVLLAGYGALAAHDSDQAEALWRRALESGDAQTRRLLQRNAGLGYLERLLALKGRLPGDTDWIDDLVEEGLETLVLTKNWDRAIRVAELLSEQIDRTLALESIAQGLLKEGDVNRALEVTERLPMSSSRREMLGQIAGRISDDPAVGNYTKRVLEPAVRESERLEGGEWVHCTDAWPALVGAYAREVGSARALSRVESLGLEAVLGAILSLAEAAAEGGDEATVSRLLSVAERGGRSNESAARLAAVAVTLARRLDWHPLAQRALRLAREYGQPFDSFLVHPLLCDLSRAARALGDRSIQRSLLDEIRSRLQRHQISPEYGVPIVERALAQIAAGQVATGELLKRETLYDAPALEAIRSAQYKALAWAEMAVALERVPPDKLNPRRLSDLLDRLVDRVEIWLGEEEENEPGLRLEQERYLQNALRALSRREHVLGVVSRHSLRDVRATQPIWQEIQAAPPNTLHSSVQPLSRLIEILAHCGQTGQIGQVVAMTPYRSDLPAVAAAAVRELIDAGLSDEARRVVMALPEGTDRTWIDVELGRIRKPKEATIAIQTALQGQWTDEGLAAIMRVASGLKKKRRRRIVGDMLRQGRDRGRRALLSVVAALASEKDWLAPGRWSETFEEILSTDGWWTA